MTHLNTSFNRIRDNFFQSNEPLSNDQIMRYAPAVFADHAHESRSSRYTFVPTSAVLEGLRREGFQPFAVAQSRSRVPGKSEFTKHMLRFRQAGTAMKAVGDTLPEVIVVGSHDGTSSYQMLAGLMRLACLNGMVVADGTVNEIRVQHKGDIVGDVIEGAYTVVKEFQKVNQHVEEFKRIVLNPREQEVFARAALIAKYGEVENGNYPIATAQILNPKRSKDAGNDLWKTFNRVQEHLVRGGDRSQSANGRRMRTREVTGIAQNVNLNKMLWTLAEGMAKLKQAA